MVRRTGIVVVVLLLIAGAQLACSIPGLPLGPAERAPEHSPTSGGPPTSTPGALPTPTVWPPPPAVGPSEPEGLTWLASGVNAIGEPEEGWQTYRVTLAYENSTDQFRNERVSCNVWKPQISTQEGYTYEHQVDGWTASCTENHWTGPWPGDCLYPITLVGLPTGVIPPGFRVRGAVAYNTDERRACVAQITVEFRVGELLRPNRLILRPSNVVSLSEIPDDYGVVDPSRIFDSLPATISMGRARVTIENAVLREDGLLEIHLKYENPDPAREVNIRDPIVGLIDSQGHISAAGSWWSNREYALPRIDFAEQCRDQISG